VKKSGRRLDAEIAQALVKRSGRKPDPDVVAAFEHMASDAESYGAENLFLARRDEGYAGDPKEFRFSEIYARRLPTYVYELLTEYIEQYARIPHDRLGRKLTPKEVDWMTREASRIRDAEVRALRGKLS